jgi:hypothetical protein
MSQDIGMAYSPVRTHGRTKRARSPGAAARSPKRTRTNTFPDAMDGLSGDNSPADSGMDDMTHSTKRARSPSGAAVRSAKRARALSPVQPSTSAFKPYSVANPIGYSASNPFERGGMSPVRPKRSPRGTKRAPTAGQSPSPRSAKRTRALSPVRPSTSAFKPYSGSNPFRRGGMSPVRPKRSPRGTKRASPSTNHRRSPRGTKRATATEQSPTTLDAKRARTDNVDTLADMAMELDLE